MQQLLQLLGTRALSSVDPITWHICQAHLHVTNQNAPCKGVVHILPNCRAYYNDQHQLAKLCLVDTVLVRPRREPTYLHFFPGVVVYSADFILFFFSVVDGEVPFTE